MHSQQSTSAQLHWGGALQVCPEGVGEGRHLGTTAVISSLFPARDSFPAALTRACQGPAWSSLVADLAWGYADVTKEGPGDQCLSLVTRALSASVIMLV